LPEGALPVAAGLIVNGLSTFVFLGIASRTLDAAAYSALGVFWALMFAVGNGIMQPLEQEVARAVSARRAAGVGAGPVIHRAALIGAGFSIVVAVVVLALNPLFEGWFDHDGMLVIAFVIGMVGFCLGHLTRGTLSSHRRFNSYARFFGVDGLSRVVLAVALGAVGVAAAGPFGVVMAITPFIGVGAALLGQHDLLEPGPEAPWSELTRNLGWLLMGTVSIALVVQGGTVAVQILAGPDQQGAAGQFLNGLQIARIPLFLFQAVLASLLPKLSHLANIGRYDEFLAGLRRLVLAILGLGLVAVVGAAVLGPTVIDAVFGAESALTGRDLALLSAAFILIMATICLDQALIALHAHSRMAVGWLVAFVLFVVVTALGDDLFLRVELGLLTSSVWAFGWMSVCLFLRLRHPVGVHEIDLAESFAEMPADL
jgi:O-antigen/teichoic acid export membrane protein